MPCDRAVLRAAIILALCGWAGFAQLAAKARRAEVVSGEPVVLDLTVTNPGASRITLVQTHDWMQRATAWPDGRISLFKSDWTNGPAAGEFGFHLDPGESRQVPVVVSESAGFSIPGTYRMTIRLKKLEGAAELEFNVLPPDPAALEARARAAYQALGTQSVEERETAARTLAVFAPDISTPLLCKALLQGQAFHELSLVEALEKNGGDEAAACLMERLPAAKDEERMLIGRALRTVAGHESNLGMRQRIAAELAQYQ